MISANLQNSNATHGKPKHKHAEDNRGALGELNSGVGPEARVVLLRDMLSRWQNRKQQNVSETMNQHLEWLNHFADELRRRSKGVSATQTLPMHAVLKNRELKQPTSSFVYGQKNRGEQRIVANEPNMGNNRDIVIRIRVDQDNGVR